MTARADLTDAQWARLEPLLPTTKRPGRPSRWTRRRLLDGIRWGIRVGCPWRDIPPQYGSWQAIYALFRRWTRAGVWAAVLRQLQAIADAAAQLGWLVSGDSTIMRAHPHAAGAHRQGDHQVEPPGGHRAEPADYALEHSDRRSVPEPDIAVVPIRTGVVSVHLDARCHRVGAAPSPRLSCRDVRVHARSRSILGWRVRVRANLTLNGRDPSFASGPISR
ncbi:IS5 family transposase [Nocardia sp. NPDC047038]|uniref:IS5 family transposase n=1 Tax=Nocardia sp. NPDC047038 TaxID=3154338 RepID=UPI00340390F5